VATHYLEVLACRVVAGEYTKHFGGLEHKTQVVVAVAAALTGTCRRATS
jgi:hypothetical protein